MLLRPILRSLWKQKGYTALLIGGLTVSLTACLLILQYVSFELSFDRYHAKADRLYRVVNARYNNGELVQKGTITYPTIGPALEEQFPEVVDHTRLHPFGRVLLRHEDRRFRTEPTYFADPGFLRLLDWNLLAGDAGTALADPFRLALSESQARKLLAFTGVDWDGVIGTPIYIDDAPEPLELTAVYADAPDNSSYRPTALISYATFVAMTGGEADRNRGWSDFYHIVELAEGVDVAALESKFVAFSTEHFSAPEASQSEEVFTLQPLTDTHLKSADLEYEFADTASGKSIYALLTIAFLIIVIAWVNYVNLSSVRAIERAQEVGVRRVIGADKRSIAGRFIVETLLVNGIALALALVAYGVLQPQVSTLFATGGVNTFAFGNGPLRWLLWGGLLGLLAIGAVLSGLYPAVLLSRQRASEVLKGTFRRQSGGRRTRQVLVLLQFVASITLIIGAVIVYQQLRFLNRQELGLETDHILVVQGPAMTPFDSSFITNIEALRAQWEQLPGIESVATSNRVPGQTTARNFDFRLSNGPEDRQFMVNTLTVDHNYFATYQVPLLAGRDLLPTDHNVDGSRIDKVLVNAATVEKLGIDEPAAAVGQRVQFGGREMTIVGVVGNVHQFSLHQPLEPFVYGPFYEVGGPISIRFSPQTELERLLPQIERSYAALFPGNDFRHRFLREDLDQLYAQDRAFGRLLLFFTLLTIFVACLGLFGLVSYTAFLRTKEIGIRKVLGATTVQITALLSRDFIRLVALAFLLATPLAWWLGNRWLADYAYRVDIQWWHFALAGAATLLLALLTVNVQSVRAALADPVDSLRNE